MVEFLTVLPYVVPPVARAAGVAAFYRANARWFFTSTYALVPFYVVMALPFTYRAIDAGIKAIDVRTLVDASRSLGAGWGTTMRRAVLPNLASSLVSASFLTATVVLGEFTIAVTLAKQTFPHLRVRVLRSRLPRWSRAGAVDARRHHRSARCTHDPHPPESGTGGPQERPTRRYHTNDTILT